jgi:hypothetical protein
MRLFTVRAARGLGLPKKNCRSRHRCLISSRRVLCGNQNPSALNAQWHYFECIHIAVLNIRTYTGLSTIVHAWLHSATIPSWLCCTDSRPNIHIVCQEFHRYDTSNSWTAYPNSTNPGSENVARSRPDSLLSKNINLFSHNYASWQLVGWRNGSAWPSYPSGYNQAKAAGSSPVLIEMG